jgi:23S rRNA pseudouridine1911/1915/1917 synthase
LRKRRSNKQTGGGMTQTPTDDAAQAAPRHVRLVSDADDVRADRWLALQLPDWSRARIQSLMKQGRVLVGGKPCKPSIKVHRGDVIEVVIPPVAAAETKPEPIPLNILYEDADILVLNKPPALVVHPAPGHASGTLVNALLHHCRDLKGIGGELRPGIVHRLDRDTSGVLVVAKNQRALDGLAAQFKARKVKKIYWALAWGRFERPAGRVETLIGRDPRHRQKMSARVSRGRIAVTRYEVLRELGDMTLVQVMIETGRTHQIRVHLAHIGHPVVGDRQYGRARVSARGLSAPRQMLHARTLAFAHPATQQEMEFTAPLAQDMRRLLCELGGDPS